MNVELAKVLLTQLIDATYDTGYYAAIIEKMKGIMTDEVIAEYQELLNNAISRRDRIKYRIIKMMME